MVTIVMEFVGKKWDLEKKIYVGVLLTQSKKWDKIQKITFNPTTHEDTHLESQSLAGGKRIWSSRPVSAISLRLRLHGTLSQKIKQNNENSHNVYMSVYEER